MIALRLTRDKARELQNFFFPFMAEVCQVKMTDAVITNDQDGKMIARMLGSLVYSSKKLFDKKLLTDAKAFTINLSDAEAICLYKLLMVFPISERMVFQKMLRQEITDFFHGQLNL